MPLSRRDFLKSIGLGAATAAVPTTIAAKGPTTPASTWSTRDLPPTPGIDGLPWQTACPPDCAGCAAVRRFDEANISSWDEVRAADGLPYTEMPRPVRLVDGPPADYDDPPWKLGPSQGDPCPCRAPTGGLTHGVRFSSDDRLDAQRVLAEAMRDPRFFQPMWMPKGKLPKDETVKWSKTR